MPNVEPTPDQLAAFIDSDIGTGNEPLRMVNLLKFRDVADYATDTGARSASDDRDDPAPGATGEEAYALYAEVALRKVAERGGRVVTLLGCHPHLVGDPATSWDQVAIIEYPGREAFLDMVEDPEYVEALRHRTAGLERTELIPSSVLMEDPGPAGDR